MGFGIKLVYIEKINTVWFQENLLLLLKLRSIVENMCINTLSSSEYFENEI